MKKCDIFVTTALSNWEQNSDAEHNTKLEIKLSRNASVGWMVGLIISSILLGINILTFGLWIGVLIVPIVVLIVLLVPFGVCLGYYLKSLKDKFRITFYVSKDKWVEQLKTIILDTNEYVDSNWLKSELETKIKEYFK